MWQTLACAALLIAQSGALAAQTSISTSGNYSSGFYGGDQATDVRSVSVSASKTLGDWEFTASLPYLSISAGGEELTVGGVVVRPQEDGARISGYGDVFVTAGGPLPLHMLPFDVSVQGQLKVPTGSSNLSTGNIDGGLDVELSKSFGSVAPFVMMGYRFYGDSNELELENGWAASAGATLSYWGATFIASYDWSQSPLGLAAAHELFAVASGPLTENWNWSVYGSKGLSDGAADKMIGLGITRSFGRAFTPGSARATPLVQK